MAVTADADLGGLGAVSGPAVVCNWPATNLALPALPWLGVLALLALKRNHSGSAWWIWVPLVVATGGLSGLGAAHTFLDQSLTGPLIEVATGLVFGVAVLWLLAGYWGLKYRVLTLVVAFPVMLLPTWIALIVRGESPQGLLPLIMISLFSVFILALSLTATGLVCRKSHKPVRLFLFSLVFTFLATVVSVGPFFALSVMVNPPPDVLRIFLQLILAEGGVCFCALGPFMVLSLINGLYRERLMRLLHIAVGSTPQPVVAPPPAVEPVIRNVP